MEDKTNSTVSDEFKTKEKGAKSMETTKTPTPTAASAVVAPPAQSNYTPIIIVAIIAIAIVAAIALYDGNQQNAGTAGNTVDNGVVAQLVDAVGDLKSQVATVNAAQAKPTFKEATVANANSAGVNLAGEQMQNTVAALLENENGVDPETAKILTKSTFAVAADDPYVKGHLSKMGKKVLDIFWGSKKQTDTNAEDINVLGGIAMNNKDAVKAHTLQELKKDPHMKDVYAGIINDHAWDNGKTGEVIELAAAEADKVTEERFAKLEKADSNLKARVGKWRQMRNGKWGHYVQGERTLGGGQLDWRTK